LAFMSTAKLFFNTTYGLATICDWQDQALLLDYLGQSRAQAWRDNLGIQSAVAAQILAKSIVCPPQGGYPVGGQQVTNTESADPNHPNQPVPVRAPVTASRLIPEE